MIMIMMIIIMMIIIMIIGPVVKVARGTSLAEIATEIARPGFVFLSSFCVLEDYDYWRES